MSNSIPDNNPKLHALLIGIDYYFPNSLEGGGYYPSLGGCVNDINHVEDFLLTTVKIPRENILKLTCSVNSGDGDKPAERPEKWPTYDNMREAFNKILENSQPGDQVYIHYSGHGGRVKTSIPETKGQNGLDETLVPTDIGKPGTRYLRDTEMAHILTNMVYKNLVVTLVLDSCHSGGATRGIGGATTRGIHGSIDGIDKTPRPQDSLVASNDELVSTWNRLHSIQYPTSSTRNIGYSGSGWLPEPKGYVLLAACRPSESAYEFAFEKEEKNGALTYWLLKSLKQIDKGITYKIIHDRLVAKVHSQFESQTPMLEGDSDRNVFGSDRVQAVYAVTVMDIDHNNNKRISLNAGQAHGINEGARFAVYPLGFTDFSQLGKRVAIVTVQEGGATNSWAEITIDYKTGSIEQGAQAVLIDPVDIELRRTVHFEYQSNLVIHREVIKTQDDALEQVKNSMALEGKGFLELAAEGVNKANFQVAVNETGEYEIWDPAGKAIPNLNPPLRIDDNNSAGKVVMRLLHLTKYNNVQRLDNIDRASPLSRKILVELFRTPENFKPGRRPTDLKPFDDDGNAKTVKVGQKIILRIKNDTDKVLNVTVFDLQPDWGISQVYPTVMDDDFIPIDPASEEYFPLDVGLPPNYTEGKDIIKVFATVDRTSFRWLVLPSLDQPPVPKQITRGNDSEPSNPLEHLMAAMTKDRPATRTVVASETASREWTTAQIEVKVIK